MRMSRISALATCAVAIMLSTGSQFATAADDVARPEEIRSMREVVYDAQTYARLADLWEDYNDAYPSEYAYANWMYAARYAQDPKYQERLDKGLSKYPANPTLLYLKALQHHGGHDNAEGRKYLEQAVALDENFVDPWFALVTHYMDANDTERLDLALQHLLEAGGIADEVMDYNYNVLSTLGENAILITNGDNDTYPAWILTRILNVRPDVQIINRSLLNADWYPMYVITHGAPRFIQSSELTTLRGEIFKRMQGTGAGSRVTAAGPFGDTLIQLIVRSAERANRPVYFAHTLFMTEPIRELADNGLDLGLVTLVTPANASYEDHIRSTIATWLNAYRTGGLQAWSLQFAPEADAGRSLMSNYGDAISSLLPSLTQFAPELRRDLFRWYRNILEPVLTEDNRDRLARAWNRHASDVAEIEEWCRNQGL